jgi:anaerobic selenocysteine-containing dehydrogenase
MAMVHASRGKLEPLSPELRSEVSIVTSLGHALFGDDLGWREMGGDYRVIRSHIERVIPGFEDFERRVAEPGGFALPRGPHDSRTFPTSTGKARFTVNDAEAIEVPVGCFLLQTVRSHSQFNTTVYGMEDRYRGVKGSRHVVFVNPADLAKLGLADGASVDLVSEWNGEERRAEGYRAIAYPTPTGCVAAYFPEANVLVPLEATAVGSNTPAYKSVVVRLEAPSRVETSRDS